MFIEITLELEEEDTGNVIRFADYADRIGSKARPLFSWEDNLFRLSGCEIINLAERRN